MIEYIPVGLATTLLSLLTLGGLRYYGYREASFKRLVTVDAVASSLIAGSIATVLAAWQHFGLGSVVVQVGAGVSLILGVGWLLFRKRLTELAVKRFALPSRSTTEENFFRIKLLRFLESLQGSVVLGASYGFLLTIPLWSDNTQVLTDVPPKDESRLYIYLFGGMIVASFIVFWICTRRFLRRLPTGARLRRVANYCLFVPGIAGLVVALIENKTRNITLANRYYIIAILTWAVLYLLWSTVFVFPGLRAQVRAEKRHFKEQRHLKRKKRRR